MDLTTTTFVNASPLENPSISLRDPAAWADVFGGKTTSGVTVDFNSVMGFPPVYRAVSLIAAKCAGTPLQVVDSVTKEASRQHPAFLRLGKNQRTNSYQNSLQFKKTLSLHAQIYGNGWAPIVRDAAGNATAMHIAEPIGVHKALITTDDGNTELWWGTFDGAGKLVPVRDDDMFHVQNISRDGVMGLSMLDLMRNALGLPLAAQEYSSRFFANGSNMSGVLMIPGHFNEEKIRNTMKAWEGMTQGLQKAHKVALLQDGAKYQTTQIDPEKSQLIQTRDHELRATVSNITGVPPHLMGDSTRTSYSSLEAENESLLNNCLRPHFDVWESEANDKLRSPNERRTNSVTIEFNTRDLLRMEFEKRTASYSRLKEIGVLTTNDILRAENLPTIGAEGDRRYVPANWVEVGTNPGASGGASEPTQALRTMAEAIVEKACSVERASVVKAARHASEGHPVTGHKPNFVGWCDGFYSDWPTKAAPLPKMTTAFERHAKQSQSDLLELTGSVTPAGLREAVEACVATWDDRAVTLTDDLIKELSNG